jgi:hypothetical protein
MWPNQALQRTALSAVRSNVVGTRKGTVRFARVAETVAELRR